MAVPSSSVRPSIRLCVPVFSETLSTGCELRGSGSLQTADNQTGWGPGTWSPLPRAGHTEEKQLLQRASHS